MQLEYILDVVWVLGYISFVKLIVRLSIFCALKILAIKE